MGCSARSHRKTELPGAWRRSLGSSAGPSGLGRHPGRRDGGVAGGPPPHTRMGLRRPVPEPVRSLARLAAMPVLVPGSSLAPGSPADCSSINPGGLRRLHSNGVTPRDAAGHRRPRHGERRTNYRAVIAQMRCRSSIARHPSFHLPDTQIQRRPGPQPRRAQSHAGCVASEVSAPTTLTSA
jgi:hypothetical protein